MRSFMRRSVALLGSAAEASRGALSVHKSGYLYVSSCANAAAGFAAEAELVHGAANVDCVSSSTTPASRRGAQRRDGGATVYTDSAALHARYSFLSPQLQAGLLARNAGWVAAHAMGMDMLERAQRPAGSGCLDVLRGSVVGFATHAGSLRGVRVAAASSSSDAAAGGALTTLHCGSFVNAAGPAVNSVHTALCDELERGQSAEVAQQRPRWPAAAVAPASTTYSCRSQHALPVVPEVHAKVVLRDPLGVIPRDSPMVICNDAIALPWSDAEVEHLHETLPPAAAARLLTPLPAGAHFRPYGGPGSDAVLAIWERWHEGLHADAEPPAADVSPRLDHAWYPEVVLRGLSAFVPGLAAYVSPDSGSSPATDAAAQERARTAAAARRRIAVDGGYYTRTKENLPLIGPAPGPFGCGVVSGAFLCGAVSGFGIMGAHAAGELAALHVLGRLPRAALAISPDHLQRAGALESQTAAAAAAPGALTAPVPGDSPALAGAGSYAALFSPLRYQDPAYMEPGGVREQLLAAGGGQL